MRHPGKYVECNSLPVGHGMICVEEPQQEDIQHHSHPVGQVTGP
jgi:hypothetical protein